MDVKEFDLPEATEQAIMYYKLLLNCYNYQDVGQLKGKARHTTLAAKVKIAAEKANDLGSFWSRILKIMQFPIHPTPANDKLLVFWKLPKDLQRQVLREFITNTAQVVTFARILHDEDKVERKAMEKAAAEETPPDPDFNDDIEVIK